MGDVSPRDYYQRQLRVSGWGPEGQETLGRATVLVVGVGGLGCPALGALARAGVGRLVFCDPDVVEPSNLPRQSLFSTAQVGLAKVQAAAQTLAATNPWVSLEPLQVTVDASNVRALVEAADLVIEGTDNFLAKFLVHDACRAAGVALVAGSVHQWEAQITVLDFGEPGVGCWRCLYPEAPADGCVGVCAEIGVAGALTGQAGHAMALAALRLLLGHRGPDRCSTLILDGTDGSTHRLRWKPLPGCGCHLAQGDWSWLPRVGRHLEWGDLAPEDRQVVVDLREPHEVRPSEWNFFREAGSQVTAARWSQWSTSVPNWLPGVGYLLVCAHGVRSQAALATVPPGIRATGLAGGMASLAKLLDGGPVLAEARLEGTDP